MKVTITQKSTIQKTITALEINGVSYGSYSSTTFTYDSGIMISCLRAAFNTEISISGGKYRVGKIRCTAEQIGIDNWRELTLSEPVEICEHVRLLCDCIGKLGKEYVYEKSCTVEILTPIKSEDSDENY